MIEKDADAQALPTKFVYKTFCLQSFSLFLSFSVDEKYVGHGWEVTSCASRTLYGQEIRVVYRGEKNLPIPIFYTCFFSIDRNPTGTIKSMTHARQTAIIIKKKNILNEISSLSLSLSSVVLLFVCAPSRIKIDTIANIFVF